MILPQLDHAPLYSQFNFGSSILATLNDSRRPMSTVIPAVRCPSDSGSRLVAYVDITTDRVWAIPPVQDQFARTNYFGVTGQQIDVPEGIRGIQFGLVMTSEFFTGTFASNSCSGLQHLLDGSSHTVIVGERYTPMNPGRLLNPNPVGHGTWVGVPSEGAGGGHTVLGDTAVDVTAPADSSGALAPASYPINGNKAQRGQTTGFGSMHHGGCHFLLGDGSVRFMSENMDVEAYRHLGSINDGTLAADF
jgi:hypothetical protein